MKRKKIAIQTCFINNYGACLQAFALQQAINSLGMKAYILPFDRYDWCCATPLKYVHHKLKLIKQTDKETLFFEMNFERFRAKNLNIINKFCNRDKNKFRAYNKKFDTFVCGSDVIWNPNFRNGENLWFDMLAFADDNANKIAYAPSLGIVKFPEKLVDEAKLYLERFNYLSCREDEGVALLKNDFGLSALHVLDPTLLISREEWLSYASKRKRLVKNDYYFIYMFSDMPIKELVEKLLSETSSDVVIIPFGDVDRSIFDSPRVHNAMSAFGPLDFVKVINDAKCVFANSLHALAFSINMNTPFVLFNRDDDKSEKSINSRIRSMLGMFGFNNRLFTFEKFFDSDVSEIERCSFEKSNDILGKEREKSFNYLKRALNHE